MPKLVPDHTERLQRTGEAKPPRRAKGRGEERRPPAFCGRCFGPVEPDRAEWRALYEWEDRFLCKNCFAEAVRDALARDPEGFARELGLTVLVYRDWA